MPRYFENVLYWALVNVLLGVFGPVLVGLAVQRYASHPGPEVRLRRFYQKGELGLVGAVIGFGVLLDIHKAPFDLSCRGLFGFVLAVLALASAATWSLPLGLEIAGTPQNLDKVWRDSFAVAMLVFSVGVVVETVLELAH